MDTLLHTFTQNNTLPIRLVSPGFGRLSPSVMENFSYTQRRPHYFFLFMVDGSSQHRVDLQSFDVNTNDLLLVLPHQLHELPHTKHGTDYFKIGFDESCLARLPRQYPFLVNPLNMQKLSFTPAAAERLKSIFGILMELLSTMNTDPELILAYLNCLLTEINDTYFTAGRLPADEKLSKYIGFKLFVENNLTDHPSIRQIATELAINTNSLYTIVKQYSGFSPKEFIINRLILEARRRLYYGEKASIKELAFELGFNDPEYFSRLFKKVTGKTINAFFNDLSGK